MTRGLVLLVVCLAIASCGRSRPVPAAAGLANGVSASSANSAVAAADHVPDAASNDAAVSAASASAANDAKASGWSPGSDDVIVDVFSAASPDRWTPLRNRGNALVGVARLTAARDAAIVTWQAYGQQWCGTSVPYAGCKGGRFVELIVKPQALPGAAQLSDRSANARLDANGLIGRTQPVNDLGPKVALTGDLDQAPIANLHAFLLGLDYGRDLAVTRQLTHCREIDVTLLGRRFVFACDGLPPRDP